MPYFMVRSVDRGTRKASRFLQAVDRSRAGRGLHPAEYFFKQQPGKEPDRGIVKTYHAVNVPPCLTVVPRAHISPKRINLFFIGIVCAEKAEEILLK